MKELPSIARGSVYRARHNVSVGVVTGWRASFTGGYIGDLPAGERVRIDAAPPFGATAVQSTPERYDALHAHFVPSEDRASPQYTGYALVIEIAEIRNSFDFDSLAAI